jgi:hypothetical protein
MAITDLPAYRFLGCARGVASLDVWPAGTRPWWSMGEFPHAGGYPSQLTPLADGRRPISQGRAVERLWSYERLDDVRANAARVLDSDIACIHERKKSLTASTRRSVSSTSATNIRAHGNE